MNAYKMDFVSKTLIITADFAKAMNDLKSEEYALYKQLLTDIPNLKVVRKTHASPKKCRSKSTGEVFNCNQFKNLTYDKMETFMMGLPNADAYMTEYLFLRNHASEVQTSGYALIRRWFVEQFPHFRKNPLFYINEQPEVVSAASIIEDVAKAA